MVIRRRRWRLSTWILLSLLTVLLVLAVAGLWVDPDDRLPQGIVLGLMLIVTVLLSRHIIRTTSVLEPEQVLFEKDERVLRRESFRRVATLAASGADAVEVLTAIAREAAPVAGAGERAQVYRYGPGGSLAQVAVADDDSGELQDSTGPSASTHAVSEAVLRTGRVARVRPGSPLHGVVGAPILVDGHVWGLIVVTARGRAPLTDDFESRIAAYAEVAGAAVSNAQTRAALAASRLRVVAAADEERRKIERNLHDGTQQRLVTLAVQLRQAAEISLESRSRDLLLRMTVELESVLEELREISRGVHPAILSQAGLRPALRSLARRAAVPVRLSVEVPGRLPEPVEVAAYYVVSEALTNAAKHSGASSAEVDVTVCDSGLRVRVADDGAGGADEARGSGIVGLRDRVETLGGTMTVASPDGGGTAIRVLLPVEMPVACAPQDASA